MDIAVVSRSYPSPDDVYNYTFVHQRVRKYNESHNVRVYTLNNNVNISYNYEGINVLTGSHSFVLENVKSFNPSVVAVHTPVSKWLTRDFDMIELVEEFHERGIPYIPWIHGHEALSKKLYHPPERFDGLPTTMSDILWVSQRTGQLWKMRKFLKKTNERGYPVVFVSDWLRRATERSLFLSLDNIEIIPNPIDTEVFSYKERAPGQVTEMLSIRPFRPKYSNKETVRAVSKLEKGHLDYYGIGPSLEECQGLSRQLNANIDFHPKFMQHEEIARLHEKYGIYLSPTKSDAQGVSMCEAMSSGLPVISTPVHGIPEFVEDGKTGFLCQNAEEIAEQIRHLQDNPSEIVRVGKNASSYIQSKCGSDVIIPKEVQVLRRAAHKLER